MFHSFRTATAFFLMHLVGVLHAQLPVVDITSQEPGDGYVEVRLRPDGFFNGVLSSVVFTLRWEASAEVSLGEVLQQSPQSEYCAIARSGPEQMNGAYRYQIFVGFGTVPFTSLGTNWQGGQEVALCRIPIEGGSGFFELADDAWADANNGLFYVSLNGDDRTGGIYSISTSIATGPEEGPWVRLVPNPAGDRTRLVFHTDIALSAMGLRMFDASGRVVWSDHRPVSTGTQERTIDLRTLSSGIYVLEIELPEGRHMERLVVDHASR